MKCVYPHGSKCKPGDRCQFPARCAIDGSDESLPGRERIDLARRSYDLGCYRLERLPTADEQAFPPDDDET